jgi:hypothetical protein
MELCINRDRKNDIQPTVVLELHTHRTRLLPAGYSVTASFCWASQVKRIWL